jgi:hypothetical protein
MRLFHRLIQVSTPLLFAACSITPPLDQQIDIAPSSLEQARDELAKANELLARDPDNAELLRSLHMLRDHVDVLNGMVDRIEIGTNHVVTFYKGDQDVIIVGERMPRGTASVLTDGAQRRSLVDLYRELAPDRQLPSALAESSAATLPPSSDTPVLSPGESGGGSTWLEPSGPRTDGLGVSQQLLTAADGPFFRDNFCPTGGVFSFCLPNWGGGAFATATSTHSVVNIAPFSGVGNVNLEPRVNGTLLASFAVFVGELSGFWVRGPRVSVRDSGCCLICACGTHLEVTRATLRWDVTNAASKGFHFGGNFYNAPLHINGP